MGSEMCIRDSVFTWPNRYAKTLKLLFHVGDVDLPERTKEVHYSGTSSREEEEDAQMCPCCKAESRTHIVGECEMYKEERDVLQEEMRPIGE